MRVVYDRGGVEVLGHPGTSIQPSTYPSVFASTMILSRLNTRPIHSLCTLRDGSCLTSRNTRFRLVATFTGWVSLPQGSVSGFQ